MSKEKINLQLSVEEAREMYSNAPESIKLLLETNFGKSKLVLDVCKRVQTIDDSFKETGRPRSFREAPKEDEAFMQATYELRNLSDALNEGEKINLYDRSERHYPCFACNGSPSGFAFDYSYYAYVSALAGSGSRLSFKEERLSKHAAKIAKDTYRTMLDS